MDDEAAALERDLLLARRLKLAVRVVVLPLLVGALVLALHLRHAQARDQGGGDDPGGPTTVAPATWTGTLGGREAAAWTVKDHVIRVSLTVPLTCRDGSTFAYRIQQGGLPQSGSVAWLTRTGMRSSADDGGLLTSGEDVRAWRTQGAVHVTASASVLWTRGDTGRVVACDGPPSKSTLRLIEAGG